MVYKYQQTILIPYDSQMSFYLDSHVPIDRIRISIGGILFTTGNEGIQLWSDLTNTVIGTLGFEPNRILAAVGPPNEYALITNLKPEQGIDVFYENKIRIQGNYQLIPLNLDNSNPTTVTPADTSILVNVEYWAY